MNQKMRGRKWLRTMVPLSNCYKYFFRSGHSATVVCSKCKKKFPGSFGNKNFIELVETGNQE